MPATWTVTNTLPPQTGTPQATRPTATSLIPDIPPRFPIATETPQPGPILPPTATRTPNFAATQTAFWKDFGPTATALYTGQGTASMSPSTVAAGSTGVTLVIEYRPGATSFNNGWLAVLIPVEWPEASDDPLDEGYTRVDLAGSNAVVNYWFSTGGVFFVNVDSMSSSGGSLLIEYGATADGGPGATAPPSARTSTFEVYSDPLDTGFLPIANHPSVQVVAATVTPSNTPTPSETPTPSDTPTSTPTTVPGEGAASVSPSSVSAASTGNTLVFEYTPGATAFTNGRIELVIPPGWSAPSLLPANPGYTQVTFSKDASGLSWGITGGDTFYVDIGGLASGTGLIRIQYGIKTSGGPGASAPLVGETSVFEVYSDPLGSSVAPIVSHPEVLVTAATATSTPTPSNTPTPTSTPTVTPTSEPPAGEGSAVVSPLAVDAASTGNELVFDFTAGATAFVDGRIEITVPTGWSPPSTTGTDPGYMVVSAFGGASGVAWSVVGNVFVIDVASLDANTGLIRVRYGPTGLGGPGATAPSTPGTSVFVVTTDPIGTDGIATEPINSHPAVTVNQTTSEGTATVSPSSVSVGSSGNTLIFEYTAGATAFSSGRLELAIPSGWSLPSLNSSSPGYTIITSSIGASGLSPGVSGGTFYVDVGILTAGGSIQIEYGSTSGTGSGANAPSTVSTSVFEFSADPNGASVYPIAVSPEVDVIPIEGQGTMTITPDTVVSDGTGYELIIDFAPGSSAFVDGQIQIVIPSNWSSPSPDSSSPGYMAVTSPDVPEITWDIIGNVLYIDVGALDPATCDLDPDPSTTVCIRVRYGITTTGPGAQPPAGPVISTFEVYTDPIGADGINVAPISPFPTVEVNP